jgi:hypothetical protein
VNPQVMLDKGWLAVDGRGHLGRELGKGGFQKQGWDWGEGHAHLQIHPSTR